MPPASASSSSAPGRSTRRAKHCGALRIDVVHDARHRACMPKLELTVLSLRYSSWSMRPWLALYHTGAPFETETVELPHMARQAETTSLAQRRSLGSVR